MARSCAFWSVPCCSWLFIPLLQCGRTMHDGPLMPDSGALCIFNGGEPQIKLISKPLLLNCQFEIVVQRNNHLFSDVGDKICGSFTAIAYSCQISLKPLLLNRICISRSMMKIRIFKINGKTFSCSVTGIEHLLPQLIFWIDLNDSTKFSKKEGSLRFSLGAMMLLLCFLKITQTKRVWGRR